MKRFVFFLLCAFLINPVHADTICTGATYYDANTDGCVACPAGYDYNTDDGKTDITQCQVQCDAGMYVSSEYTQLEYIESTGTQYIDTGVSPAQNFEIYIDGMLLRMGGTVFGTSTGSIVSSTYSENTLASGINSNYADGGIGIGGINNKFHIGLSPYWTLSYNATYKYLFRTYVPSGTFTIFAGPSNGSKATARIYKVELYDDTTLVFRGIPVRRNSDNIVGMYDTVTGTFFENAGTGTFIAGPSSGCMICSANSYCPGGTYNFGETETHGINACPDDKVSNVGADDISDCHYATVTCSAGQYLPMNSSSCTICPANSYCPGGTYDFGETTDQGITACPDGYVYNNNTGKSSVSQCQIHCDAGMYVAPEYTQLEYIESTGTQYIDTGYIPTAGTRTEIDLRFTSDVYKSSGNNIIFGVYDNYNNKSDYSVNFGSMAHQGHAVFNWLCPYQTSGCTVSSFDINTQLKTTRQTLVLDAQNRTASYGNNSLSLSQYNSRPAYSIYLFGYHEIDTNGIERAYVYSRNDGMFIYETRIYEYGILVHRFIPMRRNSDNVVGMYDVVTDTFFENAGTGEFIAGPDDVGYKGKGGFCSQCSNNNYCPGGIYNFDETETQGITACPDGLFAPAGMWESGQCGRILHIDNNIVYLRSVKLTTPSLNIDMDGDGTPDFFGNMTTNDVYMHDGADKKFKVQYNGQTYSVYDDTIVP